MIRFCSKLMHGLAGATDPMTDLRIYSQPISSTGFEAFAACYLGTRYNTANTIMSSYSHSWQHGGSLVAAVVSLY